jgi:3-oxoacyl-[acyl-carrier-protein] synthase-3
MNDIDYVLVTENNKKIRDLILERLGVGENQSLSLLNEYGNTMSAMLPCLLDNAIENKMLKPGMVVMLISQGEGVSGGGILYRI